MPPLLVGHFRRDQGAQEHRRWLGDGKPLVVDQLLQVGDLAVAVQYNEPVVQPLSGSRSVLRPGFETLG